MKDGGDYISREMAKAFFTPQKGVTFLTPISVTVESLLATIDNIPAADVREVVNTCESCSYCNRDLAVGKWEGSCRYWNTHSVMLNDWCSRYRPNCGAEMLPEPPEEEE